MPCRCSSLLLRFATRQLTRPRRPPTRRRTRLERSVGFRMHAQHTVVTVHKHLCTSPRLGCWTTVLTLLRCPRLLPLHPLPPLPSLPPPPQVSGRAQESADQAKQSTQEAWEHTKAASQETADKVGARVLVGLARWPVTCAASHWFAWTGHRGDGDHCQAWHACHVQWVMASTAMWPAPRDKCWCFTMSVGGTWCGTSVWPWVWPTMRPGATHCRCEPAHVAVPVQTLRV